MLAEDAAKPWEWGKTVISGSVRTRTELWNWFDTTDAGLYGFQGTMLRLGVARSSSRMDWSVDFAAPILLGLPKDAVAPAPQGALGFGGNYFPANDKRQNVAGFFPKQAFLRFKALGPSKASVKLGRFEFNDGQESASPDPSVAAIKASRIEQRLIGTFAFTHVGRSLDGVHFRTGTKTTLTAVAALPTRGVFQVDGWGNMPILLTYVALSSSTKSASSKSSDWRVFGSYYQDNRTVLKTDNRPAAIRAADREHLEIATLGGHYIFARPTMAGIIDLVAWGAGQLGNWGRLAHRAYSFDLEAKLQPRWAPKLKPWLRGGYALASGDGNNSDGTHGTFFQILPTPRPFARTPFYDLSNSKDIFGILILRPSKKVTLRSEVHGLWLTQKQDLWYQGGGAYQPWSFGYVGRPSSGHTGLGQLIDGNLDWNFHPKLTASFYGGHMTGGDVQRGIYGDGSGAFGYIELTYRF